MKRLCYLKNEKVAPCQPHPGGSWDHAGFYHFLCYLIQFWICNLSEFAHRDSKHLEVWIDLKRIWETVCCLSRIVFLSFKWKLNKSCKLSKFCYPARLEYPFLSVLPNGPKNHCKVMTLNRSENRRITMEGREARTRIHWSLPQLLSQRACLSFILITDRK